MGGILGLGNIPSHFKYTSPKFNSLPLKNDGTGRQASAFAFGGSGVTFQGQCHVKLLWCTLKGSWVVIACLSSIFSLSDMSFGKRCLAMP